ncbi:MAG TPA: hypothetical protein VK181_07665 [Rhizobium sp.]|nr:hypothetical protein [Rhizobium sp.]
MTHTDIINSWPTLTDFANDLGVAYGTAKAMRRRGSIPSEHWLAVVSGAEARSIPGITLEALAKAAAARLEASA